MLSDLIIRNECAHALAILSVATVVEELVDWVVLMLLLLLGCVLPDR